MTRRLSCTLIAMLLAAPRILAAAEDPKVLIEEGHYARARALIDAQAQAHPGDARTLYLEARWKLVTGEAKEALPIAERAASLAPRDADARYQVAECVGTLAQKAGIFKGLGLAKRFKREAEATLAIDPRHVDAYEGLIEFNSQAPGIAGGSDKRAYALAETLVTIDPARGRLAQATLYFRDKKEAQGEQALRQAVAAAPKDYRAQMALARYLGTDQHKQWDEAEAHARAALAIAPDRVGPYAALAALDAHLQRWDDLDHVLADAERALGGNRGPHYQAGRILLADDREPARAERLFRAYLAGDQPEYGAPTYAHAHWRLGLVLEKQGKKAEALAEVQQALTLKPDLEDAKKDLKRLKKG